MAAKKRVPNVTDYNPFEHRDVKKPNSDIRSLVNLIKSSLGSGILAVPLAFANAGWGLGIVGTVVIAYICAHCAHIFVKTSQECCKVIQKPMLSYSETCKSVFENGPKRIRPFAKFAKLFADFSLIFTYVGVCCIFTVLIADSIKQILDEYYPVLILSVEYYCLIILVPLSLMVQIRYLKWLAPFSLLANVLLISTFFICLYYIFDEPLVLAEREVVKDLSRLPVFLSTIIFAMEGIGVVMPVENGMKKPQHFLGCPGVLSIAMTLVMILYGTLGLFGYLKFGDVLKGSITLNLPIDDWPAICAKCFIAISIFFTYPLHFFVIIDTATKYIEPHIQEKNRTHVQTVTRAAVVWFCGGIAVALPMLEQITNIVGAFFYSILGLIIPAVVETVFRWEDLGKWKWILWKNSLIVLFGLGCMLSGCTVAIMDIFKRLNEKTI